mgnify:CR=1 FL=1
MVTKVDQVAGHVMDYDGMTLAIVRGAGHTAAIKRPREMCKLFNTFIEGIDLE